MVYPPTTTIYLSISGLTITLVRYYYSIWGSLDVLENGGWLDPSMIWADPFVQGSPVHPSSRNPNFSRNRSPVEYLKTCRKLLSVLPVQGAFISGYYSRRDHHGEKLQPATTKTLVADGRRG
jgi:hypothetical protein